MQTRQQICSKDWIDEFQWRIQIKCDIVEIVVNWHLLQMICISDSE